MENRDLQRSWGGATVRQDYAMMMMMMIYVIITHADGSRVNKAIIRVCVWFCLSVCFSARSNHWNQRLKLKSPNLAQGLSITIPRSSVNIRSKGKISRSQGHKVKKGDRVAGVSYSIKCPSCSLILSLSLYVSYSLFELYVCRQSWPLVHFLRPNLTQPTNYRPTTILQSNPQITSVKVKPKVGKRR